MMFSLLEMMYMMNVMNGDHGGSISCKLAKEWLEEEEGRNQFRGFQCSVDRPDTRTGMMSQLTGSILCPIDQTICPINRTEPLTESGSVPIDRTIG